MVTPFIAEIKIVSFTFPPKGWAFCNGQLLPINQNQALFSILGTSFGGDGRVTFALPNMQGRAPAHVGADITYVGQVGGEIAHTLISTEMPQHLHLLFGSSADANENSIDGTASTPAVSNTSIYSSAAPNAAFAPSAVSSVGGSQPHMNMQPFLVLNFVIALQGVFPSRT